MGFKKENGKIYNNPAVFGPMLCELQDMDGKPYSGILSKIKKYSLAYEVLPELLEKILPQNFKLISPIILINFEKLADVAWLAGRSYNRLELQTPVNYKGKKGMLNLVTWEDNADSILYGRDVHGIAKHFADFEVTEDDETISIVAGEWGFNFIEIKIEKKTDKDNAVLNTAYSDDYDGIFNLKYLPKTGDDFTTNVSYVTMLPIENVDSFNKPFSFNITWNKPTFNDMPLGHTFLQHIADLKPLKNLGGLETAFDRVQNYSGQVILDESGLNFDSNKMYMMPANFDACVTPRRRPDGNRWIYDNPSKSEQFMVVYDVKDRTMLESLVPKGLELTDSFIVLMVNYLSDIAWLAHKSYALYAVLLPVRKKSSPDTKGAFMALIEEDQVDCLLTGREQLGFCKIFSSITPPVRENGKVIITASKYGNEFLRIELDENTSPKDPADFGAKLNMLTNIWHYNTYPRSEGDFSLADVDCLCLTPPADLPPDVLKNIPKPTIKLTGASVKFSPLTWEQAPAHYRIIKTLADMEITNVYGGAMHSSYNSNDIFNQRVDIDYID